jgi:O-acetyl-ADP-ribose deacetylase (regulator of RNase III)
MLAEHLVPRERMMIELRTGDITDQPDLEAVVNAANAQLMPGGGVAGAIHRVAGVELAEACRPLAPIEPGQAVITDAFELPNRWVIHVLGPRHGIDEPADDLLASAYRGALDLCREHDIGSVGFPAISAGAFGFPIEDAARIAVDAVTAHAPAGLLVRFVLFDDSDQEVFEAARRAAE